MDGLIRMALPKLCKYNGRKSIIGDNSYSNLSDTLVTQKLAKTLTVLCLFLNAAHLVQPLNVTYYAPLKKAWRSILQEWEGDI